MTHRQADITTVRPRITRIKRIKQLLASVQPASASDARHHGLQLATAVLLAYAVSAALGLPEHFWAVMSTLIVMRPYTAAALTAGRERVLGTLAGAACGMMGAVLLTRGMPTLPLTLTIVALLAYAGALWPTLRSAPIAALIVLAAGMLPGHSALHAALLRVAQMLIGVAVALAVTTLSSRYQAAARVRAGCATLLRRTALALAQPPSGRAAPAPSKADSAAAARSALARLAMLADSADRAPAWQGRATARNSRQLLQITTQILQDAATLGRVLRIAVQADNGAHRTTPAAAREAAAALRRQVMQPVAAAISAGADALAATADAATRRANGTDLVDRDGASLGTLLACEQQVARTQDAALLAAPLRLLHEDMRSLLTCARD